MLGVDKETIRRDLGANAPKPDPKALLIQGKMDDLGANAPNPFAPPEIMQSGSDAAKAAGKAESQRMRTRVEREYRGVNSLISLHLARVRERKESAQCGICFLPCCTSREMREAISHIATWPIMAEKGDELNVDLSKRR